MPWLTEPRAVGDQRRDAPRGHPPDERKAPVSDNAIAAVRAAGPPERVITFAAIDAPLGSPGVRDQPKVKFRGPSPRSGRVRNHRYARARVRACARARESDVYAHSRVNSDGRPITLAQSTVAPCAPVTRQGVRMLQVVRHVAGVERRRSSEFVTTTVAPRPRSEAGRVVAEGARPGSRVWPRTPTCGQNARKRSAKSGKATEWKRAGREA